MHSRSLGQFLWESAKLSTCSNTSTYCHFLRCPGSQDTCSWCCHLNQHGLKNGFQGRRKFSHLTNGCWGPVLFQFSAYYTGFFKKPFSSWDWFGFQNTNEAFVPMHVPTCSESSHDDVVVEKLMPKDVQASDWFYGARNPPKNGPANFKCSYIYIIIS